MKSRDIARLRMHNQFLWGEPLGSPEQVVHHLAALQAQEYPFAKWSVAQRSAGVDDAAMQKAFDDGTILRTHILRPTWHFVLPADIRWMMSISAPRVKGLMAHYDRKLELDDTLFATSNRAIAKAISKRGHLTRKEIAEVLGRAGIEASGQRLGHIVMRAELDAVICSGAMRGKQHTYALVDERAPGAALPEDDAFAELARRYFTARGPATVKDFARWGSFTIAQAARALEAVSPALEHEVVGGRTYWFAGTAPGRRSPTRRADLVQLYDETIMGYFESRDVLAAATAALPVEQVAFPHAILLDGRLVGRWSLVRARDSIVVEASLDRPPNAAEERALDAATSRYARFLGRPATLEIVKSNKGAILRP
jgi:hypothetical protein